MQITRCDICKKVKKSGEEFARFWLPGFSMHDVCGNCVKKHASSLLKKLEVAKLKKKN